MPFLLCVFFICTDDFSLLSKFIISEGGTNIKLLLTVENNISNIIINHFSFSEFLRMAEIKSEKGIEYLIIINLRCSGIFNNHGS